MRNITILTIKIKINTKSTFATAFARSVALVIPASEEALTKCGLFGHHHECCTAESCGEELLFRYSCLVCVFGLVVFSFVRKDMMKFV